jgi:hypothetical protein
MREERDRDGVPEVRLPTSRAKARLAAFERQIKSLGEYIESLVSGRLRSCGMGSVGVVASKGTVAGREAVTDDER